MSLQITAAHSSRVSKHTKPPLLRRSSSSLFATAPRRKSSTPKIASKSETFDDDDGGGTRLDDRGLVTALAADLRLRDVAQYVRWVTEHMFDAIPERAGMNSTRIAEVLNFRRDLPPMVTAAHVHALSGKPTAVEREIAELVRAGVLRRVAIPGRGIGSRNIGEALVLVDSWVERVESHGRLSEEVKRSYVAALKLHPEASGVPVGLFSVKQVSALLDAGFLTSASTNAQPPAALLRSDSSSLGTLASLATVGSRNAAGSLGAVGGMGAVHDAGGGGSGALGRPSRSAETYSFALPSTGLYMKLLEAARNHMVALLAKSRYKEMTKDMLKERWQGAVAVDERAAKTTGLAGTVLPGRTRKWKQFYGLRFEWVLEECTGSGLVEVFDTGSVGHGIRLVP